MTATLTFLGLLATLLLTWSCTRPGTRTESGPPEENRFTVEVLDQKLLEPMQLAVKDDGKVLFIERRGVLKEYNPQTRSTKEIAKLNIHWEHEDGLLGMALDPKFAENNWIYFFYAPPGEKPVQRVARFNLVNDSLHLASEKVLLEFPVIRDCCHSGGSVEFGPDGNLYISTGDNTNPFASDGYAPIDERPGRQSWDAQKSSANPNDLRGKILRIRPQPDGTYTIPDGNLFPKGKVGTRPEIYTMGHRNPFRIAIDQKTGYLYWGEVGPDAGTDSTNRGAKGHDEVNQAKKAGNFGWPYFIGNNKPYWDYDFTAARSIKPFDPKAPVNDSPNNTGIQQLPPAQPAFIWYPYDESKEFPLVGKGGRNAMAGPVFYRELFSPSAQTFPAYYEGKLFVYDWMRNWIMAVTMDKESRYRKMEQFLPSTTFAKPVDMVFGKDGALYVLEYGTYWRGHNDDSKLIRIQYHPNNRQPVARVSADKNVGAAPLTVRFSAAGSFDHDKGDQLSYAWTFDGSSVQSTEKTPSFTFSQPGVYKVRLQVKDSEGATAEAFTEIAAGNDPPAVAISTNANRSFYWKDASLNYRVQVADKEDGNVTQENPEAVKVFFDYLPQGADLVQTALGRDLTAASPHVKGKALIDKSDCNACHALKQKSVGPSFWDISTRYEGKPVVASLAGKIIKGGNGSWGEAYMSAHPQVSQADAEEMVNYILSLKTARGPEPLPLRGTVATDKHTGEEGSYFLMASYTDKGANGLRPVTGREVLRLRHPKVPTISCDTSRGAMIRTDANRVRFTEDKSYIVFRGIDLTGIGSLVYSIASAKADGTMELRLGSPEGKLVSSQFINISEKGGDVPATLTPTDGVHDLYFVLRSQNRDISIWTTFDVATIEFRKGKAE